LENKYSLDKKPNFLSNKFMVKKVFSLLVLAVFSAHFFFALTLVKPLSVDRAVITDATATLSNPRRSFMGSVDGAHTAGQSVIAIQDPAGSYGVETTVQALFPGDEVMVGPNGDEIVESIPTASGSDFIIDGGLNEGANNDTPVIATQSGSLVVSFTIGSNIPASGYVKVVLPAAASDYDDGRPDYNATISNNGFDSNGMTISNTKTEGGTGCTWSTTGPDEVFTAASNSLTYTNVTSTQCTGGTINVTIGDATKPLVNPARVGNIGAADVYQITIETYDSGDTLIEARDVAVALVEGVLVSASVDETLEFTVAGVTDDSGTFCGQTRTSSTPNSTASTIPWGTLSSTYAAATHNAQQELTVSTNSSSGYKVYAQESDQMGLNGNECTGTAPSSGQYTFGSNYCIRDVGVGSISHIVADNWGTTPGTNYGFGYSLEDITGGSAKFEYTDDDWDAKQFADQEATSPVEDETADGAEIMTQTTGPVDSDNVYVCFRINIPSDQPSGFYYNVIKYTAVPIF
jgi:hypothetical protein